MRQLVYALCFTGRATPTGADGGVLSVTAIAPSSTLTATVGPAGLAGTLQPIDGGEAVLASEVTLTGATSFQEVGTIAFGGDHRLRFSTVGSGHLGASPDPAGRHGAVTWRVEGGDGQFAGARGLITSIFVIDEDLAVTAHHLGVVFLPGALAPRRRETDRAPPRSNSVDRPVVLSPVPRQHHMRSLP